MGKTHGGMTRVGKVRSSTPTVAKAVGGKKPKTGRARKREVFNRRIKLQEKNLSPNCTEIQRQEKE